MPQFGDAEQKMLSGQDCTNYCEQFNNWWIPTYALFHIQHCISLECWF